MEILITGGAGFIGSHILAQLQGRRDMDVVVFDNLSSGSKEHVPAGMELVEGDVCDEAAVDALLPTITLMPSSIWRPRRWSRLQWNSLSSIARLIWKASSTCWKPAGSMAQGTSFFVQCRCLRRQPPYPPERNGTARADVPLWYH